MKTVTLFHVKDNIKKLDILTTKIHENYQAGKRILVAVPNIEAAQYIDQLIWKQPQESFTPHQISDIPNKEQIVITIRQDNLNNAQVLFNLCSEAPSNWASYELIFDLLDATHPKKLELSHLRIANYEKTHTVEILDTEMLFN